MSRSTILQINTGRVASVRLAPNEDLVESLDQAAASLGFRRALVRSGLGSLIDAAFEGRGDGAELTVAGPAVELLAMSGEIFLDEEGDAAGISGIVGDPSGKVFAGKFLRGRNPICVTIEAVLEELLAAPGEDWRKPF